MRPSHAVVLALAAFVAGVAVETDLTYREKRAERELQEEVAGVDRFVDAGVILKTVVKDPSGEELIIGSPLMRVVNVQHFGGMIDTADSTPYLCGRSLDPVTWFCSTESEPIILHSDKDPLGQLAHGSEGAGKTTTLAQWHYFRWLENLGEKRTGGQFAPTLKRLGLVQKEMEKLYRPSWGRYVVRRRFEGYMMCDGASILFQSTHKQSAHQGSPVQGANLSWTAEDEKQDMVARHGDVMSRGRSAKNGRCKRLGTATAKDDSDWRELRDVLLTSGQWTKRSLSIYRTPFVDLAFLGSVLPTISKREALRRYGDPKTGEVGDLPPELAVYYGWNRARCLVANPRIATDVTSTILADYPSFTRPGARTSLLCTHDPGAIFNTTEIARLLVFPRMCSRWVERDGLRRIDTQMRLVPTWTVVGELQTSQTTARAHARELKQKLESEFHVERPGGSKAAVFIDPHGKGEGDTDYETHYTAFTEEGLDAFNPAPVSGMIRRGQRVEMMNRLLDGSAEDWFELGPDGKEELPIPRLVIALNEDRVPVAPHLVKAFESLRKNPGDKNPEGTHVKDARDKTHPPASLSYGLWPFEREAVTLGTVERAVAEARRIGVI